MSEAGRKKVERLIEEEEYEQALTLMTQLSIQDAGLEALLLIKSGEYELALAKGIAGFEAAYCHYRLGNYDKALLGLEGNDKRSLILKGQIYYKLGKYPDAYEVYSHALSAMKDDEDERKNALVNLWACKASMAWTGHNNSNENEPEIISNSYEVMYNKGIELMAQDQEDAALLFKASSALQQREEGEVDPAVQYNLVLCLGKEPTAIDSIAALNQAILHPRDLNKSIKVVKKEISKPKLPHFQKQLAVEHLICRAVEEKKYHTAHNLSRLISDHSRVQPHLNFAIKKCTSLKDVPIAKPTKMMMTLDDLEVLIQRQK